MLFKDAIYAKLVLFSQTLVQASPRFELPAQSATVDNYFSWAGVFDIFFKLGFVILLIYATLYFVKKFNLSLPSQSRKFNFKALFSSVGENAIIRQLASTRLTPTTTLYVIQVETQRILISVSGQDVKVLLHLTDTLLHESQNQPNESVDTN